VRDERNRLAPETVAVTAGRGGEVPGAPLNVPVHLASMYREGGPVNYAREGNPTWSAFEEAVGSLEGGQALCFASGMGAVSAILEQLPVGAVVVAANGSYTGTRAYLSDADSRGRLEVRLVDVADTQTTLAACVDAALLWVESPTNPLMAVADLRALAAGARASGALLVVDNTFATPLLQQPLALGADMVVHSASKYIAGHSDVVMGVLATRDAELLQRLTVRRTLLGAAPGPLETFLALRGLRTLPLRVERGQHNAGELARRLTAHPAVERVRYPGLTDDPGHARAVAQMSGFGAMLAFDLRGGAAKADALCATVSLITHATSLGGVESTLERRGRYAGEEAVPAGLVRLSVGCEHVDDLWSDLCAALDAV
jgi:cystathionine gamma-synthase